MPRTLPMVPVMLAVALLATACGGGSGGGAAWYSRAAVRAWEESLRDAC